MPRLLVVTLTLTAAALAGCTSSSPASDVARPEPSSSFTAGKVPVLVPGAPGEDPTVLQPGQSGAMANAGIWGDEDVTFMTDMVGHHSQALEMAQLAPDRAKDERVLRLAERVAAGQGPEIKVMQTWLAQQGLPPASEKAGHGGHADMPGMATPEEMARLVGASGEAFDRLFLTTMVKHHTGALRMADQAVGARNPIVSEMVDDVVGTQGAEIKRMRDVLLTLPL